MTGGGTLLGGNATPSLESAQLSVDGALTAFELEPITLSIPRGGHACAVVGEFVYAASRRNQLRDFAQGDASSRMP